MPPGWDRWVGYQGGAQEQSVNNAFKINDQGEVVRVDATKEHDTDYFARKAERPPPRPDRYLEGLARCAGASCRVADGNGSR